MVGLVQLYGAGEMVVPLVVDITYEVGQYRVIYMVVGGGGLPWNRMTTNRLDWWGFPLSRVFLVTMGFPR